MTRNKREGFGNSLSRGRFLARGAYCTPKEGTGVCTKHPNVVFELNTITVWPMYLWGANNEASTILHASWIQLRCTVTVLRASPCIITKFIDSRPSKNQPL